MEGKGSCTACKGNMVNLLLRFAKINVFEKESVLKHFFKLKIKM